jgi:hypothetical protein
MFSAEAGLRKTGGVTANEDQEDASGGSQAAGKGKGGKRKSVRFASPPVQGERLPSLMACRRPRMHRIVCKHWAAPHVWLHPTMDGWATISAGCASCG